jgi:exodeoxyribonuclease VII small subunit
MTASPNEKMPSFEASIRELEGIIDRIESGEVPLEESINQCVRGKQLIAHCEGILGKVQSRLKELQVEPDGKLSVKPDSGREPGTDDSTN